MNITRSNVFGFGLSHDVGSCWDRDGVETFVMVYYGRHRLQQLPGGTTLAATFPADSNGPLRKIDELGAGINMAGILSTDQHEALLTAMFNMAVYETELVCNRPAIAKPEPGMILVRITKTNGQPQNFLYLVAQSEEEAAYHAAANGFTLIAAGGERILRKPWAKLAYANMALEKQN